MTRIHSSLPFILAALITLLLAILAGCSGKQGMASPQVYGRPVVETPPETTESEPQDSPRESSGSGSRDASALSQHRAEQEDPNLVPSPGTPEDLSAPGSPASQPAIVSYGGADISDSAAAVDDEVWRQFDLAEEYYLMGVMANREASWEEAQYYFERGLHLLAKLDIEDDSVMTPEAVRYDRMLANFVADYRTTLRSLGSLEADVSTSVLVERFGNIADNLAGDTIKVYDGERTGEITYDLPVVQNERVKKSVIYFQTVAHDAFSKYLSRINKYTPMMRRIIAEYGLPQDLIYLSLVESGYNPNAYSWARAMGLWQFISSTGRLYNLDRNWWIDERKDPIKATHAACRFLKDLYEEFGDWELAMAAYNGGPGRVRRTIKSQKTNDFWKLRLKRQTMDYVPLIYAAAIIAKDPEKYGFVDIEKEPEVVWDEVTINRCLELKVVAEELGCPVEELQELNPELLRKFTPPNDKQYVLKVPQGTKSKFLAAYDGMPSPKETSWVRHNIQRGESVSQIAAKYGVSQYAIMDANNLSRRSRIYAGKELIVPVPLDREYNSSPRSRPSGDYKSEDGIYVVRSGDTMWDIAREFGTSVNALRGNNSIERGSRIYVGQKIKIPSSATKIESKNRPSGRKTAELAQSSRGADKSSTKHKVRSGDTLWDIARKYGTTTGTIRSLNGLGRSSQIYPGQVLVVNGAGAKDYLVHHVRQGDTLSRLAQKYRTSIARIIANNDLADPDELIVGMTLRIYTK
ncbi:MAG: LysM peptidoglycan-binding domain-containing protein [bacterium]